MNRESRRFNILAFALLLLVVGVGTALLVLKGHNLGAAVTVAGIWAAAVQGLAWGVAELLAPGWVIRWRERLIAGNSGILKGVGDHFSRALAIEGPSPWESQIARRRIRRSGLVLTLVWVAATVASVFFLGPLDSFYSTLGHR